MPAEDDLLRTLLKRLVEETGLQFERESGWSRSAWYVLRGPKGTPLFRFLFRRSMPDVWEVAKVSPILTVDTLNNLMRVFSAY